MKSLIACSFFALIPMQAQVMSRTKTIENSYLKYALNYDANKAALYFPLTINGEKNLFRITTHQKDLYIDSAFAKTANLQGNPTKLILPRGLDAAKSPKPLRSIAKEIKFSDSDVPFATFHPCFINDLADFVVYPDGKSTKRAGGVIGLDFLENSKACIDFNAGCLYFPKDPKDSMVFSDEKSLKGHAIVNFSTDTRTREYFLPFQIVNRDVMLKIDLSSPHNSINSLFAKQLQFKEKDGEIIDISSLELGPAKIESLKFKLDSQTQNPVTINGRRVVGSLGLGFFVGFKGSLDFNNKLLFIPASEAVTR